jgi:hypothetical protein
MNYSATQYALFSPDAAAAEVSGGLFAVLWTRSATAIFHRHCWTAGVGALAGACSRLKQPAANNRLTSSYWVAENHPARAIAVYRNFTEVSSAVSLQRTISFTKRLMRSKDSNTMTQQLDD